MTKESLDAAIAEAKRFLEKAKAVKWRKIEMAHGGFYSYVESGAAAAASPLLPVYADSCFSILRPAGLRGLAGDFFPALRRHGVSSLLPSDASLIPEVLSHSLTHFWH